MPEATVVAPAVVGNSPGTAIVPATGTQIVKPGDKPAEPTGRNARLAALAKLEGATDGKPATEPVKPADKPAEEGKKPARTGYSAARIAELETENASLKSASRDSLLAELKENPGRIFKLLNDPDLLTKLAEAKAKGDDPNEVIKAAIEEATKPLKEQAEKDKVERDKATVTARNAEVLSATRLIFANGHKDGEEVIADPTKWKLSTKLTTAGIIDAPADAMATVSRLVTDIQGNLKAAGKPARAFTNKEAATMLAVAFDAIEKREVARGVHYRDEAPTPKGGEGKGEKPVRTQISSRIGYGQTVVRESNAKPPKNQFERRAARLASVK